MTEEQYRQYRSELNQPYTHDELGDHLTDREAKSMLEYMHGDNFRLIRLVQQWKDAHYVGEASCLAISHTQPHNLKLARQRNTAELREAKRRA